MRQSTLTLPNKAHHPLPTSYKCFLGGHSPLPSLSWASLCGPGRRQGPMQANLDCSIYSHIQNSHYKIVFKPPIPGSVPRPPSPLFLSDHRDSRISVPKEERDAFIEGKEGCPEPPSSSSVPGLLHIKKIENICSWLQGTPRLRQKWTHKMNASV